MALTRLVDEATVPADLPLVVKPGFWQRFGHPAGVAVHAVPFFGGIAGIGSQRDDPHPLLLPLWIGLIVVTAWHMARTWRIARQPLLAADEHGLWARPFALSRQMIWLPWGAVERIEPDLEGLDAITLVRRGDLPSAVVRQGERSLFSRKGRMKVPLPGEQAGAVVAALHELATRHAERTGGPVPEIILLPPRTTGD